MRKATHLLIAGIFMGFIGLGFTSPVIVWWGVALIFVSIAVLIFS